MAAVALRPWACLGQQYHYHGQLAQSNDYRDCVDCSSQIEIYDTAGTDPDETDVQSGDGHSDWCRRWGGGSGANDTSADGGASGGSGGGGGAVSSWDVPRNPTWSTETVTVGAGGSGGLGVTTSNGKRRSRLCWWIVFVRSWLKAGGGGAGGTRKRNGQPSIGGRQRRSRHV